MKTYVDPLQDIVTCELADGRCVKLSFRTVQEMGLSEALRRLGLGDQLPAGRLPVFQHGRMVGTLPADFDPMFARSLSFLYDVRPGDFEREGEGWRAHRSLGPGDLEAISGFAPA